VSFANPMAAQAAGISTIYQEVNLVPRMSVAQNLFLAREPRTRFGLIDRARVRKEAAEQLAAYGITADVDRQLDSLVSAHARWWRWRVPSRPRRGWS